MKITTMETILEHAAVYKRLYKKSRKARANTSDKEEMDESKSDRNPKKVLSRKITEGRREERDIRGFSDEKWASFEEWEVNYEIEMRREKTSQQTQHKTLP